jgi:hypothetical protein
MMEFPIGKGKFTKVDDEDIPIMMQRKWFSWWCGNRWYAVGGGFYLHRLINKTPKGMETDHINGDGLDNRKENLRTVTKRENAQNKHIPKTSKYPGVLWHKGKQRWRAQIRINGDTKYLGHFKDEVDAFNAYKKAVKEVNI